MSTSSTSRCYFTEPTYPAFFRMRKKKKKKKIKDLLCKVALGRDSSKAFSDRSTSAYIRDHGINSCHL